MTQQSPVNNQNFWWINILLKGLRLLSMNFSKVRIDHYSIGRVSIYRLQYESLLSIHNINIHLSQHQPFIINKHVTTATCQLTLSIYFINWDNKECNNQYISWNKPTLTARIGTYSKVPRTTVVASKFCSYRNKFVVKNENQN